MKPHARVSSRQRMGDPMCELLDSLVMSTRLSREHNDEVKQIITTECRFTLVVHAQLVGYKFWAVREQVSHSRCKRLKNEHCAVYRIFVVPGCLLKKSYMQSCWFEGSIQHKRLSHVMDHQQKWSSTVTFAVKSDDIKYYILIVHRYK